MRKSHRDLRLRDEPFLELSISGKLGENSLDGQRLLKAVSPICLGKKHLRHAANRDAIEDVVSFEAALEVFGHRGRNLVKPRV